MRKIYFLFWIIFFFLFSFTAAGNTRLIIEKPAKEGFSNYSGNNQQGKTGEMLENPVRVRVRDSDGSPAVNVPVVFDDLASGSSQEGIKINPRYAFTDKAGIAYTNVQLGSKKGSYMLIARLSGTNDGDYVVYNFTALADNWIIMMVFGLFGGLGLFLLGMNMMSQGMMKSAGDKMRSILGSLTRNRFFALGLGTFVTMIIQSSSATTVMLISLVNAGLIRFAQTLGIILGADIGTTITAQLIALKLTDYALLMVAVGFAVQTFPKSQKIRYVGEGILGFGILFFGMHIMSESMYPLRTFEPFINLLLHLESPFTGILIGAAFTALIQSSGAFIGIMIVLATQGLLSLEASVPLLLGANIGTAITAFLASINTNKEARKVAVAHALFKILGVILIIWWIPDFIRLVKFISPSSPEINQLDIAAGELPRQIANAHTLFNVLITAVTLPFINSFARLINYFIPEEIQKSKVLSTKYLREEPDMPPSLALNLAKEEVIHMAHVVQEMTEKFIEPFISKKEPDTEWMREKEDEVDFLRDNITSYILKIASDSIKKERVSEAFEMLYTVKEFEQIADILSSAYLDKSEKWVKSDYEFSEEGKQEILTYHIQVQKQITRAVEAFKDFNLETARLMDEKHHKYRQVVVDMQRNHYNRLADQLDKSVKTSKTHLEIMTLLATVYSHATNVARIILQVSTENVPGDGKN